MNIPRNLISDSALVQEVFDLLRGNAGRMTLTDIVDRVFHLADAEHELAGSLVRDLIGDDPRFNVAGDFLVATSAEFATRPLTAMDFVVLDIEATSDHAQPARIVELGAYRVQNNQIGDSFQTLVNPGRPLSRFVSALTGISDPMLADAPQFGDIANAWLEFAGDSVTVAHNSRFDLPLLNREIARVFPGYRMGNDEVCTVNLTRSVFPDLNSYRLEFLAEHFGFDPAEHHRALPDALTTARVLLRLLAELAGRGVQTLSEIQHLDQSLESSHNCA